MPAEKPEPARLALFAASLKYRKMLFASEFQIYFEPSKPTGFEDRETGRAALYVQPAWLFLSERPREGAVVQRTTLRSRSADRAGRRDRTSFGLRPAG